MKHRARLVAKDNTNILVIEEKDDGFFYLYEFREDGFVGDTWHRPKRTQEHKPHIALESVSPRGRKSRQSLSIPFPLAEHYSRLPAIKGKSHWNSQREL
jgi:hypothetical protein